MLVLLLLLGFSHLLLLGAVFTFLKQAASKYNSEPKKSNFCCPHVCSTSPPAVSKYFRKESAPTIADQYASCFPTTSTIRDCNYRKKIQKFDTTTVPTLSTQIDNKLLAKKPLNVKKPTQLESHVDTCKVREPNGLHNNAPLDINPKEKNHSFEEEDIPTGWMKFRVRKRKMIVGKLLSEKVQELVMEDKKGIHWYCPVEINAGYPKKTHLPLLLCLPGWYSYILSTHSCIIPSEQIIVVKFLGPLKLTLCVCLSVDL